MSAIDGLLIRPMTAAEAELAVEMAAQEGWNPGLHDAVCFYIADPEGFIAAELQGQFIGCVAAVQYDDGFAFGGLFLVKEEYRGKGIGACLVKAAFQRVTARCFGNDGVVAQQENYKKLGFVTAHRSIRYEGTGEVSASLNESLVPLDELPFDKVAAYDYAHFKARRERFLDCWIRQPGSRVLGYLENGELQGCGVLRKCRRGFKIGPLFAARPDIAEAIYTGLSHHAAGETVVLDIPEPNQEALNLVRQHGMKPVFETARMYKGPDPQLPLERIYGITSFEIG